MSMLLDDQLQIQFGDMPEETLNDEVDPSLILEVEHDDTLKRKLRNKMWNHFKRHKINEEFKSVCNYCGRRLGENIKHRTKHLHDYFEICPLRNQKQNDVQKMLTTSKTSEHETTAKNVD